MTTLARVLHAGLVLVTSSFHSQAKAETMDEVVITASRIEQPVFEVPQAVSRLDRKEILKNNYRTTPESLSEQPGIMVQKTAHGHGSPFIRGLTGKQVLILVDGIRLNNSTFRFGPNQYLNTIDPMVIDHIETVRGPGSVLYGSDALGGVINIITRKREDFTKPADVSAEANLAYGSADNERTGRASMEGNQSSFGYWIGGGYRDFGDLEGGGDVGRQDHTGYDEYHANGAFSYLIDRTSRLDLTLQHTHQNNVPRTDKFNNSNESQVFDPQERTAAALLFDGTTSGVLANRIKASLGYQRQKESLESQKFGSTLKKHNDDEVQTWSLNLQADVLVGERNLLSYGTEYQHDTVDSRRINHDSGSVTREPGSFPDGSKYHMFGIYLQDEYTLTEHAALTAGVRYSRSRVDTKLEDFGNLDETYDDVTASLRGSWEFTRGIRLFGGINQGFRAPNLDDVAVLKSTNEGIDAPSPGLDSENSLNYELGFKLNRARVQGTLVGFYSDFDDLIERRPGTYKGLPFLDDNGNGIQDPGEDNIVQKFNIGEAHIWGVELDGRVDLGPAWYVHGNFMWTRGENDTDDEPLSRIPPRRLLAGIRWHPDDRWWLEPSAEFVARQERLSSRDKADPRIPDDGTPGYGLLNLRGGWNDRAQSINVAFNNIFDQKYKVHGSGVFGPGREIKISYIRRF